MEPMQGKQSRSRPRQSAAERRASIDSAARALALSQGLQGVTLRAIAQHLGITHTLVAHHAPEMSELRVRVCGTLLLEEFETTVAVVAPQPTAVARLSVLIRELGRTGREDRAGIWFDGWSIGRKDPLMAATVRSAMERWQDFLVGILAAGREHREFSIDDPAACAWEFIALLDGINAHIVVGYGEPSEYATRIATSLAARLSLPPDAFTTAPGSQSCPENSCSHSPVVNEESP